MFIGEFFCCLPLIWKYFSQKRQGTESMFASENAEENRLLDGGSIDVEDDNALKGWRVCWMWFPAFFDSE